MGGKPSKGTRKDRRLKENKRRKSSNGTKSALRKGRRYPTDGQSEV